MQNLSFMFLHLFGFNFLTICLYVYLIHDCQDFGIFQSFQNIVILHIWKNSNLYLWPEFKNLFNYTIWNFEMILKIQFWKTFSKLPISYLIFYVHHLFLKIAFFERFFKRDIKLFLIGGENEFSILFKINYSILIYCIIQVILKGGKIVHKLYNL